MNKEGFTLVEVVIAFSILALILASIIGFTVYYRDRIRDEQTRTQLLDFKSMITKIIYDDIIDKKVDRIEICAGTSESNISCVNFVDKNNNKYRLEIVNVTSGNNKGIYLSYRGVKYLVPDSDLSEDGEYMCNIDDGFILESSNDIYKLKINYTHYALKETFSILLNASKNY